MKGTNRTHKLCVRLTDAEFSRANANLERFGIRSMSHFMRKMLLDGHVIVVDTSVFDDISYQLNRIGNNLNQLTRSANGNEYIDQDELSELNTNFKSVMEMYKKILSCYKDPDQIT